MSRTRSLGKLDLKGLGAASISTMAGVLGLLLPLGSAHADTPTRCLKLDELPRAAPETLKSAERQLASAILRQAERLAREREGVAKAVLTRLPSSNPAAAYLLAYVPGRGGSAVSLVVSSTHGRQLRSLINASNLIENGLNEPQWQRDVFRTGENFKLREETGKRVIEIVETVSQALSASGDVVGPKSYAGSVRAVPGHGGPSFCRSSWLGPGQ